MRTPLKWQHSPAHYLGDELETLDLTAARVLLAGPVTSTPLTRLLRDEGYDVVETTLGYDVLRYVKTREVALRGPADVILIDTSGHPARGLWLVDAIRRNDWSLPVIALCAEGPQSHIDELRRLGAVILPKSVDPDAILAAVVNAMPPFASLAAA